MSTSGVEETARSGYGCGSPRRGQAFARRQLQPAGLPDNFAVGNGRIEGTEIDIATKAAGASQRSWSTTVMWSRPVSQVVAQMDTQTLEAELRQAQAQVRQAQQAKRWLPAIVAQRDSAKATAIAVVAQRESAKATAAAVVAQRQSESGVSRIRN